MWKDVKQDEWGESDLYCFLTEVIESIIMTIINIRRYANVNTSHINVLIMKV